MLLQADPWWAVIAAVAGALAGHLVADDPPVGPRSERPLTADELLAEPRQATARPRPPPKPHQARDTPPSQPPVAAEHAALARALAPLFIEVARADGNVSRDEIRATREFFQDALGFAEHGSEELRVALKLAMAEKPPDVEPLVKEARAQVKPALRLEVVRALYDVALVDGGLTRTEAECLKRIVQHLNLSDEQLQQVTQEYFGGGEAHYQALGLLPAATDDEIRAAFRRLAAENHPDRAASLGPAEAEAAATRFRAVKDAYEELRKIRGF